MKSVLYPVMHEPRRFGPDDVLGETAYFGPYDPDHVRIDELREEHATVLLFHVPFSNDVFDPSSEASRSLRAFASGVWTLRDVMAVVGSDAALEDYLDQLIDYASYVVACRRANQESFSATPWTMAGTILSYPPDEAVPVRLGEGLSEWRRRLTGVDLGSFEFVVPSRLLSPWLRLAASRRSHCAPGCGRHDQEANKPADVEKADRVQPEERPEFFRSEVQGWEAAVGCKRVAARALRRAKRSDHPRSPRGGRR